MLLITHDLGIVRKMADRVCVMTNGEIVERGTTHDIFASPQHPYTRMLIAAEPSGAPQPVPASAPVVAEARDLGVTFPVRRGLLRRVVAEVRAVDGVSLHVREGETLGLVGESGSGKSTIGLAMLRLQQATGRVLFEGADITKLPQPQLRPLRRRMQIVFQDPYGSLSPRMSVAEIIAEGLRVHEPGLSRRTRMDRVEAALAEVGLNPDSAQRYPHEFSGGQRQRIAVARAIVLKPRLVVLDEPTSALDRSVQAQLVDLLRGLQQVHGLAYLFISHDLAVVRALAHRVAVLQAGRVVEQGPAEALFARPQTAYAVALMAAAFPTGASPEAAAAG